MKVDGVFRIDLVCAALLASSCACAHGGPGAATATPTGNVLSLSQPDGAQVPRDSVIDVTVSKGPAPVPIPDVTGRSVVDATNALAAAGFPVTGVDGSPGKPVLATDPPANEPHVPGTPVRLFTRK